jgi:nitric oxide reductase NorQ protein
VATKGMTFKEGTTFETVFWRNQGARAHDFPFRATLVNGTTSGKVLLCADRDVQPGRPARARVKRVKRPQDTSRGFVEVEHLGPIVFALDPDIYVDKAIARKLQVLLEAGYSILLDGPQGSGKTVLSRAIADALEMSYVYFNCASVYEATDFVATLQVRAAGPGTVETVFIPTDFRRALDEAAAHAEQRFLVFLDEFNRCRPMARNGLMPALDSTRKVYDPATNSLVGIPDNVQFIAAINNGAQFVGATAVDPAQMDRFATLKLSYPPPAEELRILAKRHPGVPAGQLDLVVKAAAAVRGDATLGVDLSMRATDEACVFLSHPFFAEDLAPDEALRQALSTAFCGRFPGALDDDTSEAAAVWRVVRSVIDGKQP